jgi:hypothetical protein
MKCLANRVKAFFLLLMVTGVVLVSCSKQSEDVLKGQVTVTCDTVGMKYSTNVLPILTANCYSCHANGIVNGGVSLDGYSSVVKQVSNGNLVAAITHAAGVVPMPYNGGKLSDCDITIIKAWINEGTPNN